MWIELTEDIDECLENITNPMSKYAIALNTVFDSMIKGLHIVLCIKRKGWIIYRRLIILTHLLNIL